MSGRHRPGTRLAAQRSRVRAFGGWGDPAPSWPAKLPLGILGGWSCLHQHRDGAGEVTRHLRRTRVGGWPRGHASPRGWDTPCFALCGESCSRDGFRAPSGRDGHLLGWDSDLNSEKSTARQTPAWPRRGDLLHPNLPRGCHCTFNTDDLFQIFIRTHTWLREARGQLSPPRSQGPCRAGC